MAAEMDIRTFDYDLRAIWRGPLVCIQKSKSASKAKEYLGDLRIVAAVKIGGGKREFGEITLRELRPEHIDQLTNELKHREGWKREQLSGTRMNTLLIKGVRSVLDLAYAREYMATDPHGWFTSQTEQEADIDPLSFDDVMAFLAALPDPKWTRFYTVAFGMGLRPSEQFALA